MDRPTPQSAPETPSPSPSSSPKKGAAWVMLVAVALSALSLKFPLLALAALAALVIAAAQSSGLVRALGLTLGLPLVIWSSTLFLLQNAAPGIVASGRRAAESKAVARMRELHWAQDRAHLDKVCDFDNDGQGDYAFIGELTGEGGNVCQGGNPLRVTSFRRVSGEVLALGGAESLGGAQDLKDSQDSESDGSAAPIADDSPTPPGEIYRGDGFNYVLYLPDAQGRWRAEGEDFDRKAHPKRWIAFAWPAAKGVALRSYFIDQNERVCESVDELIFDAHQVPPPSAGPISNWQNCEGSPDGIQWRAWKGKKPREAEGGG